MLSLVWKDFYINRSQLVFPAIVLCAIALLAAVGRSSQAAVDYAVPLLFTYSGMMVPFFALNSAMLEEKNRTLAFLRSLPMSTDAIVASKFVSPLLVGALWAGSSALAALIIKAGMGEHTVSIMSGMLLVCATLPIAAIELVVFFRFGASAARTALIVTVGTVYLVPLLAQGLVAKVKPAVIALMNPEPFHAALLAGGSLLLYFAGMPIAQAILRRREI
ncbi:MAG: ABC-2 transporter permease [Firmicutes bacterium]|nr:ABC-2 transporter permease [Bacillota bacterium]